MTSWGDWSLTRGIDCEMGGSARLLPLLLKSVTTFFNNLVLWDWCFFHISNPVSKNVKRHLKTWLKIYLYKWR